MASAEFDDKSEEKRPTVQVGDPFTEERLIEACLELMAKDADPSIQDMGAAGLTSSSVEMADKGGVGIDLDLDAVPQRESGMTAYEMMLSESQERMLMILKPGSGRLARSIITKWDLDFAVIGTTTATGRLIVRHKGAVEADLPSPSSPTRRRCTSGRSSGRRSLSPSPPSTSKRRNRSSARSKPCWARHICARDAGSGSSTITW